MPAFCCRFADRLWMWLQTAPPPLPLLTDLDRSEDGTLDLRQHWSGRFMSAKLEAAYAGYTLIVWRPRLRGFFVFLSVLEASHLTKSLLCNCGLRFETYEGWALVYAFAFLMSSIVLYWLLLSPKLTHVITTRRMPWLIPMAVMIDIIGYVVPLAIYLDHATPEAGASNLSLAEDASAMQIMKLSLVDQGAWFSNAIMIFTMLTSLASVSLGVGAIEITLFMPVAILGYMVFERKRFWHKYAIEPSLVPQSLVVYALCTFLTFCHTGSTRQQFLVRIYVQHERDLRVEQLEREKERLDYERLFALQKTESGVPKNASDNGNDGHDQDQRGTGSDSDWSALATAAVVGQQPQAQSLRSASRGDQGGGLAFNGRRIGVPFSLSSHASSSGVSEPELIALGAAPATLTNPQVSAGCGGRARSLMLRQPPSLGHTCELNDAGDEARSHQNASSVASDATSSSSPHILSEERDQALKRTLDSVGIAFAPRHENRARHHGVAGRSSTSRPTSRQLQQDPVRTHATLRPMPRTVGRDDQAESQSATATDVRGGGGSSGGSSVGSSGRGRRGGRMRLGAPNSLGSSTAERGGRPFSPAAPAPTLGPGWPGWFARFPARSSPASTEALAAADRFEH